MCREIEIAVAKKQWEFSKDVTYETVMELRIEEHSGIYTTEQFHEKKELFSTVIIIIFLSKKLHITAANIAEVNSRED